MSPSHHMLRGYAKVFTFTGRACRSEFWWLFAANFGVFIVCVQLTAISPQSLIVPVFLAGAICLTLGNLSAAIRRLRDSGQSTALILATLVPFGFLVLAFLLMRKTVETEAEASAQPPEAAPDAQEEQSSEEKERVAA